MSKLYNPYSNLSSNLVNFFTFIFPSISKPHLKNICNIILDMINSESIVTSDIEPYLSKPRYFDNVKITSFEFPTKLAISKSDTHKEAFYIFTNGNTCEAIKHYYYRFGSIECIFKNQKYNDFYLESIKMRNINSCTTLFTLTCIAVLWLFILGSDYSKNKNHFQNFFKIKYSKKMERQ